MHEQTVVKKKRKKRTLSHPRGVRAKKSRAAYSPADKLKAVRLRLEEGFSSKDVCAEMGMATTGTPTAKAHSSCQLPLGQHFAMHADRTTQAGERRQRGSGFFMDNRLRTGRLAALD